MTQEPAVSRLTRHFSPAMLVAIVALLSSLTGGAIAAKLVVTGKNVKNSSLTGIDVKNRSLTGADVKPGSVGADRLSSAARAALKGATGDTGPQGLQGVPGTPGAAGAPGPSAVTQTLNAGTLNWSTFDNDPNATSTSINGGYAYASVSGTVPRSAIAQTVVLSTVPGGTTGKVLALHLCYRATTGSHLNSVSLARYRGDEIDPTGLQNETALLTDTTERQDAACRRYPVTGDQAIRVGDSLLVRIEIAVTANGNVNANRLRILSVGVETTA